MELKRVIVRRDGSHVIIDRCPLCAGRHVHGAANEPMDCTNYGSRQAHCTNNVTFELITLDFDPSSPIT